ADRLAEPGHFAEMRALPAERINANVPTTTIQKGDFSVSASLSPADVAILATLTFVHRPPEGAGPAPIQAETNAPAGARTIGPLRWPNCYLWWLLRKSPRPHAGVSAPAKTRFSANPDSVLLATDVAARGLDIPGVEHVVHYQ
uniref:Helicase C-terminal domain-containing protein n=1 Tax=Macrostomum lignano TaxID=282301 RepID=A0A1I8FD92_9PLAT